MTRTKIKTRSNAPIESCPLCHSNIALHNEGLSPARASFVRRFIADRADEMTKKAWEKWVNALPAEEFWIMVALRDPE